MVGKSDCIFASRPLLTRLKMLLDFSLQLSTSQGTFFLFGFEYWESPRTASMGPSKPEVSRSELGLHVLLSTVCVLRYNVI